MEHKINFLEDWRLQMLELLTSAGYKIDVLDDIEKVSYKYWNVKRKELQLIPRKVYEAENFAVPDELKVGYLSLKSKVESGTNINPHLSKFLLDTSQEDLLLNDWGIHHFHLNTAFDSNGWIERSGPLLFAYVKDDGFYCLKIGGHGDWADIDLLQTIHKSWPELLKPYHVNIAKAENSVGYDLLRFRKAGLTVFHELEPGVFCMSPGGGYSSCRTSMNALWHSDFHVESISNLEAHFRNNIEYYIGKFEAAGFAINKELVFQLVVNERGFHVWIDSLKIKIHLANPDYSVIGSAPAISIMYFSLPGQEEPHQQ